jgi:hypothetical protein
MNTKFQTSRPVKAAKSSLTPMQKVFVDCEERRRSMFLYVARELTGRALQKRYIAEDKNLDWTKFNEYFETGYEQYSADEIRDEIIANVYWIKSEVQIIELYFRYLDDVRKNSAQTKNNKSKDDSFDFSA